jgi:LysM repeat protein
MKINRGMNSFLVLALLFFCSVSAFGQTKHTVAKGETVTQIAQKYKVTPYDIYKLNPDAQSGIKENDIILIPAGGKGIAASENAKPTTSQSGAKPATHTAKPKETLYSISKQYGVTVDELVAANPTLSQGLKIGQTIKIPGGSGTVSTPVATTPVVSKPVASSAPTVTKTTETRSGNVSYHIVEPKETKFGIAKKYGMTVAELEQRNPDIVKNLPIGFKLIVSGSGASETKTVTTEKPAIKVTDADSQAVFDTQVVKTQKKTGFANYEVKAKETIYSLSQLFDISEDELVKLNPSLKDGLKVGMILKVPGKGSIITERSDVDDLSKNISSKNKKQLVLLLPFNASKIQGDTLKSITERLKKDAFLNMTLDFYSGALMAVDSAKALGMNIDVRIYDSEESKLNSNVANVIQNNNFRDVDAVIGPFYQQHAEKAAELLGKADIPVISPMSKEAGKPFANLYQAMPSTDAGKSAMFDFMIAKGGNIIIVADPKRATSKEFITKNYPQAKFTVLDDNGGVNADNLKSLFVKDQKNYVVLDTEKTGMILSTTNLLLNEINNFQLQLVILEPNETLDYEEISMKRLTILKLLYPSLTRENETPGALTFESEYKKKNKIFPSQYAVRGFDVTFDTMLRLSQDKSFSDSATSDKTEQVESKFSYAKNDSAGYMNKGVYILEYQEDLSVKEAQ